MLLFERGMESQAQVNKELAKSEVSDHIREVSFRLIASGMSDLEFDSEGGATRTSRLSCDWAVIETDSPSWSPEEVAVIHPPAMDPDWVVPEDVELFILGYSSIFEGATPRRGVDSEGSDIQPIAIPPIPIQPRPRDLLPFIRGGPYTLKGRSEILDGIWYVTYPHEWPRPGGHSGGGVFLWNEDAQRLELVGVFHTWDQATKTTIWESSLFGISVLSVQRSSEEKIRLLAFSPISGAGQALGLHRD
jgi:hypothetical protein